mmetsp:Transcript_120663/g.301039  ORF Transcript_120663/g.301039 Transcript_120663/m.301039 type:complete len:253 (+) Transcript_120663:674-1432(+)
MMREEHDPSLVILMPKQDRVLQPTDDRVGIWCFRLASDCIAVPILIGLVAQVCCVQSNEAPMVAQPSPISCRLACVAKAVDHQASSTADHLMIAIQEECGMRAFGEGDAYLMVIRRNPQHVRVELIRCPYIVYITQVERQVRLLLLHQSTNNLGLTSARTPVGTCGDDDPARRASTRGLSQWLSGREVKQTGGCSCVCPESLQRISLMRKSLSCPICRIVRTQGEQLTDLIRARRTPALPQGVDRDTTLVQG